MLHSHARRPAGPPSDGSSPAADNDAWRAAMRLGRRIEAPAVSRAGFIREAAFAKLNRLVALKVRPRLLWATVWPCSAALRYHFTAGAGI